MGIDLGDVLVRRDVAVSDYAGKTLAFDAWNILYQFLASIRQPDGTPLTDASGRVTSHLAGTLYRTSSLMEAGIRPIFVFDGQPHPLKKETLRDRAERKSKAAGEYEEALAAGDLEVARSKAMQTSRLSIPMVEEAKTLLQAMGVTVVQAPGEGEAQASWMAAAGHVHAVVSQDFDAVLFGAPRLVRSLGIGGRRKLPGKQVWVDASPEEVDAAASLDALGLNREQLVDAAVLVGTDFHPGVKGIGAKKAVALVKEHGSLDAVLAAARPDAKSASLRAIDEQRANLEDRVEVRRIFLDPAHVEMRVGAAPAVDAEAVRRFMVQERGFSAERVNGALARIQAAPKGRQATLF